MPCVVVFRDKEIEAIKEARGLHRLGDASVRISMDR
jgi:hypothetical protein